MCWPRQPLEAFAWKLMWLVVYAGVTLLLAFATLKSFDRCIGRARSDG